MGMSFFMSFHLYFLKIIFLLNFHFNRRFANIMVLLVIEFEEKRGMAPNESLSLY